MDFRGGANAVLMELLTPKKMMNFVLEVLVGTEFA
jgi:hypothetical protein